MPSRKLKKAQATNPGIVVVYEITTGALQILLGLGLFSLAEKLYDLYQALLGSGLVNSHDFIENVLLLFFPFLLGHHRALAILLLVMGTVKFVCGVGLAQGKEWGKIILLTSLILLIPTDIISLFRHYSTYKIFFLGIDMGIIFLLTNFRPDKYFSEVASTKVF